MQTVSGEAEATEPEVLRGPSIPQFLDERVAGVLDQRGRISEGVVLDRRRCSRPPEEPRTTRRAASYKRTTSSVRATSANHCRASPWRRAALMRARARRKGRDGPPACVPSYAVLAPPMLGAFAFVAALLVAHVQPQVGRDVRVLTHVGRGLEPVSVHVPLLAARGHGLVLRLERRDVALDDHVVVEHHERVAGGSMEGRVEAAWRGGRRRDMEFRVRGHAGDLLSRSQRATGTA